MVYTTACTTVKVVIDLWSPRSPFIRHCGDQRPRNRLAIPTTGYGLVTAQIQAYLDRTTRFSRTGSNRASSTGKKTPVQSGANLAVYIRTISGRVDLTCILYINVQNRSLYAS